MNIFDLNLLSEYNNRVHKGIVHTPEYAERMKKLQKQFDEEKAKERKFNKVI